MDVEFCTEAHKDALRGHGKPEMFNTDSHTIRTVPGRSEPNTD